MNLEYRVIRNFGHLENESKKIREQIFELWQREWEKIYASQNSEHRPLPHDFTRHHLLSVILHEGHVASFFAHTFLDLDDKVCLSYEYLLMFTAEYIEQLLTRGIRRIMSFESWIANPEFKFLYPKFPIGRLLLRTNSYLFEYANVDAGMAITRSDNGAAALSKSLGWWSVQENIDGRGFPCEWQLLLKERNFPKVDGQIADTAETLWSKVKIDQGIPFLKVINPGFQNPYTEKAA